MYVKEGSGSDSNDYSTALETAKRELDQRLLEKRELEARIAWLQATIASLARIVSNQGLSQHGADSIVQGLIGIDPLSGLTDSCRQVLMASNRPLQASEIVRLLSLAGFDISKYANPLSAIRTVLDRLVISDQAQISGKTTGGKPLYEWNRKSLASKIAAQMLEQKKQK